ncbi:MAG: universal stress protein [Alphaproteobacteria bacterium]|jgi:nucleotide-binding universal stress UspA family protein|nr:universal stress protein [Planctomycetaceae bacterium]MBT3788141.1 universal stress protein [Alphaproteobacteria bacterium]MBT4544066.1 universal stress protein [Alphaproteobacteria bacterium]MBT7744784.1 universal stress protein [Alphaproteobacteria bacterium]
MIRTIFAATDGSDHANKALKLASDLAAKYRARLILLHVPLFNASSETLKAVATRSRLSKSLRDLLDTYEADFQLKVASAGIGAGAGLGFAFAPPPRELIDAISGQIMTRAEKIAAKAGVKKVTPLVAEGDPADVILNLAASHKVDMIVLGSRGLSDFKGLLVGSVSHKVGAQADCSCITVK